MEKIVWYRIPFITLSFNPEANISFEVKFKLKFHIIKISTALSNGGNDCILVSIKRFCQRILSWPYPIHSKCSICQIQALLVIPIERPTVHHSPIFLNIFSPTVSSASVSLLLAFVQKIRRSRQKWGHILFEGWRCFVVSSSARSVSLIFQRLSVIGFTNTNLVVRLNESKERIFRKHFLKILIK